jgi:uncharacterized membrane protein YbhN (UPF0104 family)
LNFLKHIVPKRFEDHYQSLVDSFLVGFAVTKQHNKFLVIIVLSLLIYFFYALGLYVPFFAFTQLAGHHLDFGASVILLTISTIAFALPAPGALGTYHSFLTAALIRLYGVDPVTALSFSIVTHEVGYIVTTVVGSYFFIKDHIRVSDVVSEQSENTRV